LTAANSGTLYSPKKKKKKKNPWHGYAQTIQRPNGGLHRGRSDDRTANCDVQGCAPLRSREDEDEELLGETHGPKKLAERNFCACAALHISLHKTEDKKFISLGFLFIYFWRFL
jgi:hypothetical protein